jgi:photosystem II stability/assembly factor-like uncharacterized protein
MKKLLLIVSVVFFTGSSLFAQSGWFPLNSGTSQILQSVYFTDVNTGYAVGYTGTVLKTTNAGVNWFSQTISTTDILFSVFFTDINTGYIASGVNGGSTGNLFKTTNGGNTWNAQVIPVYAHFKSVYFRNSNTGYVTGYHTILKTTNAGNSWESQDFSSYYFITSIHFADDNIGFATGGLNVRKILKTTNGGSNWQEVYSNTTSGYAFYGIHFIDANTGFATGGMQSPGYAFIIRTTNGGLDWDNYTDNNNTIFKSVRFVNPAIGFVTGGGTGYCTILKTTNGGLNWYYQTTNANNFISANYFTSLNTGYVVGYSGTILKTTDGGGTLLGINSVSNQIPAQFSLLQNYPNPFNPTTNIKYQITNNSIVLLKIYDALGREIETLVNEEQSAGTYEIMFNASQYPSGVYFYKLEAGSYSETKKMLILK